MIEKNFLSVLIFSILMIFSGKYTTILYLHKIPAERYIQNVPFFPRFFSSLISGFEDIFSPKSKRDQIKLQRPAEMAVLIV